MEGELRNTKKKKFPPDFNICGAGPAGGSCGNVWNCFACSFE